MTIVPSRIDNAFNVAFFGSSATLTVFGGYLFPNWDRATSWLLGTVGYKYERIARAVDDRFGAGEADLYLEAVSSALLSATVVFVALLLIRLSFFNVYPVRNHVDHRSLHDALRPMMFAMGVGLLGLVINYVGPILSFYDVDTSPNGRVIFVEVISILIFFSPLLEFLLIIFRVAIGRR